MNRSSENRILLVDHDPTVLDEFRCALELGSGSNEWSGRPDTSATMPPVEIDWVRDGYEGWKAIRQAMDDCRPVAMAVLRLEMPGGWDGLETARRLRDIDPQLLIVLMLPRDGLAAKSAVEQCGGPGRVYLLPTPLEDDAIRQAVAWQLEYLALREELQSTVLSLEQAEQTIRKLHENLQSSDHLYRRVMRSFSHDARSPMHAILGFSSALMRGPLEPDKLRRVQHIHEAGRSLLRLIDEVLDYAELSAGQMTPCDSALKIDTVLSDVLAAVGTAAERRHMTVTAAQDDAIPKNLVGDESRLRKVLLHLVDNAIRYAGRGVVRVECSLMASTDQSVTVRFAISDEGPGLSDGRQAKLFDPPPTDVRPTGAAPAGLGLGLVLCRKMVEMMGGRIGVESMPGHGSTFWFSVVFARQTPPGCPGGHPSTSNMEPSLRGAEHTSPDAGIESKPFVADSFAAGSAIPLPH